MVNEVTESNTRQNIFKSIYTLINNNKISGSSVLAGFSADEPLFPCYVIQPAQVSIKKATKSSTIQDYEFQIEIELWATSNQLKAKIDEMKDNIQETILNNITTLENQNLDLAEDWYDDSNVETVERDEVKYHTGAVLLSFNLL